MVHSRDDGGVGRHVMQMIGGEIRYSDAEHLNRKVSETGGKGGRRMTRVPGPAAAPG